MTTWLLLPSPLLGPSAWDGVARELRRDTATDRVEVVDLSDLSDLSDVVGGDVEPGQVLDGFVAAARSVVDGDEVVVVPHSNAGLYVPAVADAVAAACVVYVDAALAPSVGTAPLAPPHLLAVLEGLADVDGRLPPWTRWWDETELEGLFPDDATRQAVEADEPRLRLDYFRGSVPTAGGWEALPSAYLAFGRTYADEVARAEALGWPVRTLDGRHLHLLVDPVAVADAIRGLRGLAA